MVPVNERLGFLSDLYDIAFGICNHDDERNVISTVAYHAPEGLFDQEAYGKKLEVYISQDVQRVYTFEQYMNLTTYQTRVLHKVLSNISKETAGVGREDRKAIKAIEAHSKALAQGK